MSMSGDDIIDLRPVWWDFDHAGHEVTIYVGGELEATHADRFTDHVLGHIGDHTTSVWLDLSALSSCDSIGLEALARIHQRADDAGATVTLYRPQRPVLRDLELAGLARRFVVIRTSDPESRLRHHSR